MPRQNDPSGNPGGNNQDSESRTDSGGGGAAQPLPDDAGGSVAHPSITATDRYEERGDRGFRLLRLGVDSLYLSFHGELFPSVDSELAILKNKAQSPYPDEKAEAQKQIGAHIFEVWDKRQGPFAYVLQDGSYRIAVKSGQSGQLPLAYVQISADLLAHVLPDAAVDELKPIIQELGDCLEPGVSRGDIFADFVTDTDFQAIPDEHWIMQCDKLTRHTDKGRLTGWSFAPGSSLSGRLYDKTAEIRKKKHKTYLFDLWKQNGWDGVMPVWRMEFQFDREILAAFRLNSFEQFRDNVGNLWQTVTATWLRLAIPSETDTNRSRWPVHPTWDKLNEILWRVDDAPLTRHYTPARVPSDEYLARTCVAATTSYMAKNNISDYDEGVKQFQQMAKSFTSARCVDKLEIPFEDWIAQQVSLKARKFNSRRNAPTPKQEAQTPDQVDRDAVDYSKQSKGE
jgi:hypothetical protein